MSFIPAFEVGLWNAWILMIWYVLVPVLSSLGSKGRAGFKKLAATVPIKHEKILNISSMVPGVVGFIYSIFLPLQLGTLWFYIGLFVFLIACVISVGALVAVYTSPIDEPFTKGAYRCSRHPLYVSAFLIYLSVAIACVSWVFVLLAVITGIHQLMYAPAEERYCLEHYGDAYREYMNKTPRWIGIPKLREK